MFQRTVASLILFLGVLAGSSDAAPLFADEPLNNPDAELEAIVKEWSQANTKDQFERYGERCFQLVEAYPRSSAAMRALVLVVGKTPNTPQATRAIELLKPRVAEADLEYVGKNLGWVFPYGMADLAPLVFTKAKSKPEDPYAPSAVVWVCLAAGHGNSNKLCREAVEYLVQHYGDSLHPWSVLQYVDLAKDPDTAWPERQLHAILAVNKNDQVRQLAASTLAALFP